MASLSGFSTFQVIFIIGLRGLAAESLRVGRLSLVARSTVMSWMLVAWFCGT